MTTETTTTVYHSSDWQELVAQGWVTMTVERDPDFGFMRATMIRQWHYGRIVSGR